MPKPKGRKGSYVQQSKKRKRQVSRPAVPAGQSPVTPAEKTKPSPVPGVSRPAGVIPSPVAVKPATVANPYIGREIGTISILAAVMVVILFVLARVLS